MNEQEVEVLNQCLLADISPRKGMKNPAQGRVPIYIDAAVRNHMVLHASLDDYIFHHQHVHVRTQITRQRFFRAVHDRLIFIK